MNGKDTISYRWFFGYGLLEAIPHFATVSAGETATFTVGICGTNAGNLSVQWQVRTKSTEAWDNVNPRIYAGGTTSTLSVPATMARNGYEYRCVVKNSAGSVDSNSVKLTVVS